jgi:hypothetical protein
VAIKPRLRILVNNSFYGVIVARAESTSASSASVRGKSSGAPISPSYSTVPLGKMLMSKWLNFGGSGGVSMGAKMSSIINQFGRKRKCWQQSCASGSALKWQQPLPYYQQLCVP